MKRSQKIIFRISYLMLLLVVLAAVEPVFRTLTADDQTAVFESTDQNESSGEESDLGENEDHPSDWIIHSSLLLCFNFVNEQAEKPVLLTVCHSVRMVKSPPELG